MDHIPFSYQQRDIFIRKLKSEIFDVVIIGGGITGAGIALDAAARGLKTALIEKIDFASGTSSRSTKLIHGGLRYLKQLQIKVVAETGRERAIVHSLAPHLVVPEKMMLPVYKGLSTPKWMISLGLFIYDRLAGVKGKDRKKMLDKKQTLTIEPILPENNLTGSGYYAEYMTDDARLTAEVIKTAVKQGAVCLNYIESKDFLYDNEGKLNGIRCFDRINHEEFNISGEFIINATGIWVDDLRRKDKSLSGKHLLITKGVHLVFDRKKLPLHNPLYFEISDGRMIFMIPRHGITYIGTTDTPYQEDKDHIPVNKEDVDYLMKAFHDLFPDFQLEAKDILTAWSGLRPLIYEKGKSASEISRKDEIFISPSGLISMAGGKLTGYRKMAEKAVDLIVKRAGKKLQGIQKKSVSHKIPLTDPYFTTVQKQQSFEEQLSGEFLSSGINKETIAQIVFKYGRQAEELFKYFGKHGSNDPLKKLILAELDFCLAKEMVYKPLDFLERRSGRLFFDIHSAQKYYPDVLEKFKDIFHWDENQYQQEKSTVEKRIQEVTLEYLK